MVEKLQNINLKTFRFITTCKGPSSMTHIEWQKLISSTRGLWI